MNQQEQQLAQDRANRDAARAVFDARLTRVRGGLAERGVGARIMDDTLDRARAGADEAVAVARENRLVVAGTVLALAAWMLRRPLARLAGKLAGAASHGEPGSVCERLREWTVKRIRT